MEESRSRSVAAVERAMDVLLLFGRTERPDLGVTEIAGTLGLTKAAVHRILTALRNRELITLDPQSRRYALGHAAVALGQAYLTRADVREMAAPELKLLSGRTGETATLSLRRGDTRLYVDQVVPDQELRLEVTVGVPFPLHAGASSKTFLAYEPAGYLDRCRLEPLTDRTIVDPAHLRRELGRIRELGYAISHGERQPAAASIAAPIFDHDGHVAAVISVAGPEQRFEPGADPRTAEDLLDSAARVSAQLGFKA